MPSHGDQAQAAESVIVKPVPTARE
jgi:hypothetical protein